MPHLTLSRVSTHTGTFSLSFDVGDGECLALFGTGKSGITAALNAIAGLTPISEGEILIDGRRIDNLKPARRRIGMIFHDFALYPHICVRENILFALKARKLAPDLVQGRFERICGILPIKSILERKPHTLTMLEKALTALARTLMEEPDLILMQRQDSLNAEEKEIFFRYFAEVRRELRPTILFAARTAQEAFLAADRIAVMRDGRLVQIGTPEEIYLRPIDSDVALTLTGCKPTLFEARIEEDEQGKYAVVISPAYKLPIAPGMETRLIDGQSVMLCLRPESITVCGEGAQGTLPVMQGILVEVRRQVPDCLVCVALETGAHITLRCSLREGMALTRDKPIFFSLDSSSLLIFDSQTGDALY
jgi:ABC-type sugar transport system ATPase subunit